MSPNLHSAVPNLIPSSGLEEVADVIPDAIMILDAEWRIVYANRMARVISRLLPEHFHGPTHWVLFPETAGTPLQNTYFEVMQLRVERRIPAFRYEPFDVWLDVHVLPVAQGIALYYRDITEQQRTVAALIQSEKLAAVGRMASSIAHEINNPLESVTNLLYIARTYALPAEVQHFLSLAEQELRRVSVIANQTLRFHKQAAFPREITCVDLFSTVLSLYEGKLRNAHIQVEKRKRAERPIACFEGDIRQVLNNLVSNAIDSMPTGGRLMLRSRKATDWRTGRQGLALTVADTGAGIPPHTRTHIFEAFFTTKGNQGTGLGLWISHEIMERHEGRMLLRSSHSAKRHGTVFSIFLPFDAVLPPPAALPN